jgi:hypothetical protein
MSTSNKVDGLRAALANGRNSRERRKLLDRLVDYGEKIGRLSSEDVKWRSLLVTIDAHLKSVTRVERSEREMRRHLRLEKADVLAFQKRIAKQLSQTRNEISRTKWRLRADLNSRISLDNILRNRSKTRPHSFSS